MGRFILITLFLLTSTAEAKPLRLLFVGNSLTFMPDWNRPTVPAYVRGLLESKRMEVEIDTSLRGGHTLENHWSVGEFQQKLKAKKYDFVIIQAYSIEALVLPPCFQKFGPNGNDGPKGRASFLKYGEKMIQLARENGATPLVFEPWIYNSGHAWLRADFECLKFPGTEQTWYGGSRAEFQHRLHDGYRALKELMATKHKFNLRIVHIGDLWSRIRNRPARDLSISMLYQEDQFHPSYYGSLLSALEIVEQVTGKRPTEFNYRPEQMTESQVDYLESISAN
jgi:hypothetical protein